MTDHGPVFDSDYDAANPALVLTDVEGWSGSPVQAGYDKLRKSKDDLKELRGEIEREIGGFVKSIKVGVDYTDRDKTLTQIEGFLAPPGGASEARDPRLCPAAVVHAGPRFRTDPVMGPARDRVPNVLDYVDNTQPNSGYHVIEKVWTPYVMAPLNADLGAVTLTGNIGFQGVHTSLTSASPAYPTNRDHYWMWLPSLNLNFRWDNGFVIRFAASKEYMRPRLTDLNNSVTFGYNDQIHLYRGNGGNPFLRPYQAKALDLNFEKYFGSKGYVALQTYYKHIDTYIASGTNTAFDFSPFPVPVNQTVAADAGRLVRHQPEHARRPHVWRRNRGDAAVRRLLASAGRLRNYRRRGLHQNADHRLQRQSERNSGLFEVGRQRHRLLREQWLQRPWQHALPVRLPRRLRSVQRWPRPSARACRDDLRRADRL